MRREIPARFVLVVGALTMLATSAPQDFEINNDLLVTGDAHVRVRFSAGAAGDTMQVVFHWDGTESASVMPDPRVPQAAYLLGSMQSATYDVASVCDDSCDLVFTVDAPPTGTMYVEAISQRAGDPSFCFPDNREFPDDATIEVSLAP